jgi:hypothetical protein
MAYAADWTEYAVNGTVVYSHRICDGKRTDQVTTDALAVVAEILQAIG